LKLCDGTRTFSQLVEELETKFETSGLAGDIEGFLTVALENGWITQK
jgi:hypothetical protein